MADQACKPAKYVITPEAHEAIKRVYQSETGKGEVRDLARGATA